MSIAALMNAALQLAIQRIVENVPSGCFFDSHHVIAALRNQESDELHRFLQHFDSTKRGHTELSKQIRRSGVLVRKIGDSWSNNIRGKPCKCACWYRLDEEKND